MVAVIKTGASISRAFYYNERKVQAGVAECIKAANCPMDAADMPHSYKLNRLLHQEGINSLFIVRQDQSLLELVTFNLALCARLLLANVGGSYVLSTLSP
jgi:hypothetical protein